MGHHYRHLDMDERRQLMKLRERKVPVLEIARLLGRHPSTLYRELTRNYFRDRYPEFSGWYLGPPISWPDDGVTVAGSWSGTEICAAW